jgi:hypothetical protein
MENLNESTRKSSNTYASVETSNRTIGQTYSLSSNLRIMHVLIAAPINHHSKSGMGFNPRLNHHSTCKPDYKALTNVYNTWSKYEKKSLLHYYSQPMKCARERPLNHHTISTKTTSSYSKLRISRPPILKPNSHHVVTAPSKLFGPHLLTANWNYLRQ